MSFLYLLLILLLNVSSEIIKPDALLVSFTIDVNSDEVVREGLRLFLSIAFNGSRLRHALVDVCLVDKRHRQDQRAEKVISLFNSFSSEIPRLNIRTVQNSSFFPSSDFSPTIHKLCSFESSVLYSDERIKYFMYLDADIFLMSDPLARIEEEFISVSTPEVDSYVPKGHILCSRPWNTYNELKYFFDFVDFFNRSDSLPGASARLFRNFSEDWLQLERKWTNNDDYPMMKTISPGGMTFHGLCNTGVYFMTIEAAQQLFRDSINYLSVLPVFSNHLFSNFLSDKSEEERELILSFYSSRHYMIDSLLLWASSYHNNHRIILSSIQLNYIIAAGNHLLRFHDKLDVLNSSSNLNLSDVDVNSKKKKYVLFCESSALPERQTRCFREPPEFDLAQDSSFLIEEPLLLHFSKGSDLFFQWNESSRQCSVLVKGVGTSLNDHNVNYLDSLFQIIMKKFHSDDLSSMPYVDVDGDNGDATSSIISSIDHTSLCALYSSWIVVMGLS
jgi:hypothetical protein